MGYLSLKLLYELVTAHNSFYNYWVGCITRAFNAGLLSSLWKTDHGLEGAKLDRLSEFSRICGLGTEHKSRRAFSFWSERKRPVTGAREWSDVPTGSEHPGVVLWWHFRQHLCKLILNLLMIIIININTLALALLVIKRPQFLRNCALARNGVSLNSSWKLENGVPAGYHFFLVCGVFVNTGFLIAVSCRKHVPRHFFVSLEVIILLPVPNTKPYFAIHPKNTQWRDRELYRVVTGRFVSGINAVNHVKLYDLLEY